MDRFFGFDLGDAESAVSRLQKTEQRDPEVLKICGEKSLVSAYALMQDGELVIGEKACYLANAVKRKLRFKSGFLTNPEAAADIKSFAAGVLGELYGSGDLVKNEDCCFYIGCPAGWDRNAREQYREIFERVGYPPARIVSESRAALVSACQSRHLQVGQDILSKPVLVVDIGSSTTDFAYITNGREVEMQTAGEVALGGGIMDEILLEESVAASPAEAKLRTVFQESEAWKNYCEFAARRLKEKYFSDEEYWKENACRESVQIRYRGTLRLTMQIDRRIADRLLNKPVERLGMRSFHEMFVSSLREVRENISGQTPELLFLTGGVSKLPAIRKWCQEVFGEAVVITGVEPEFSVSRGLAACGRIDEELREFRKDLDQLTASSVVESIVREHIGELYRGIVEALVDPILEEVAIPVFEQWRDGEIRRLSDTDEVMRRRVEEFLHSDEARELLAVPIAEWMKPVADELEEYTVPICVKHQVPYTALSLNSFFSASDIDIRIDAKNVFAVGEVTWMIDSIISILVGLICGGSGIALVSGGVSGIVAGILISLLVLVLGKEKMENALLDADLPVVLRKMVSRRSFRSRLASISADVKDDLTESFENEKNEEITSRLVDDLSSQIELCLTKMAEVVEIPLGS